MLLLCNHGPLLALGIISFTIISCVVFTVIGKAKWY